MKTYYQRNRVIQRNWRAVRARWRAEQDRASKIWLKYEKKVCRARIARNDRLGAKGLLKLPMADRVALALLPDAVREDYIRKELRAVRFFSIPAYNEWKAEYAVYARKIDRWFADKRAAEFLKHKFKVRSTAGSRTRGRRNS